MSDFQILVVIFIGVGLCFMYAYITFKRNNYKSVQEDEDQGTFRRMMFEEIRNLRNSRQEIADSPFSEDVKKRLDIKISILESELGIDRNGMSLTIKETV